MVNPITPLIKTIPQKKTMETLKIPKPDFSRINETVVLEKFTKDSDKYKEYLSEVNDREYLYWEKVQYKTPPPDLNNLEYWFLVKQVRKLLSRPTPIRAEKGGFFTWVRTKSVDEYLHTIDMHTGGQIFAPYEAITPQTKQKFISRGIIEEAIASSQLEGATTTGPVAKKLILENRAPRNESEIMIVNNYKTMQLIDEDYKNKSLTKDLLFEMHRTITKAQSAASEQGRYRRNSDEIVVGNETHIAHIPPDEKFLDKEMERLIQYANDEGDQEFIHPVVKAIFIHFWVGYLHPFTDGNGRLARAIFYWYLLRKGYWTMMYLPISTIIRKSPAKYANAYLWAEQDDLDLTYFFDYHIRKVLQSIKEFSEYVDKTVTENRHVDEIVGRDIELNERQKQAIHHLVAEGENSYATVNTHVLLNRVGRLTARKDLVELEKKNLLSPKKVGKVVRYYPSSKLLELAKAK